MKVHILGSQKGLEAPIKFLTASDAFKKTTMPPDLGPQDDLDE
jgi:hypothetical protein